MKVDIHPEYKAAKVVCACGNVIETRSTRGDFHIEICSNCHPFFTGKQKVLDTAGRIERFKTRYASAPKAETKKAAAPASPPPKAEAKGESRAERRAKVNAGKPKPQPKAQAEATKPQAETAPEAKAEAKGEKPEA